MMVKIVTGKINSLKTTKMIELYEKDHLGDGFVSIKKMDKDKVHSYSVRRLSTKEEKLLIIRDEYNDENNEVLTSIGPYQFLDSTIKYVEEEIKTMIKNEVSTIYLDEIGILELEDKAFAKILRLLIKSDLDLIISVRENLVKAIIKKFGIKQYVILN